MSPIPPITVQEPIPEDSLSFLEIGRTARDDVLQNLGAPSSTYEDGSTLVFLMRIREVNRWGVCGYFGVVGGCEADGTEEHRLLITSFDDDSLLTAWEQPSVIPWEECDPSEVCMRSGEYEVPAAEDVDAIAKRFAVSGDSCAVYLYTTASSFRESTVHIANTTYGRLWNPETYLTWTLAPASYIVHATHPGYGTAAAGQTISIDLQCDSGSLIFLHILYENRDYRLALVSDADGKSAIMSRHLLLKKDLPPHASTLESERRRGRD